MSVTAKRISLFFSHVNKDGPLHPVLGTQCWLWTGSTAGGYGRFWDGEKFMAAHRYSWEIENGPMPSDLDACHSCDNPICVRPDHVHPGTTSANIQEMWDRKRRNANGENNTAAKLTQADADEIRSLYGYRGQNGLTLQALATTYGVGTSTIYRIVTGKCWGKEVSIE